MYKWGKTEIVILKSDGLSQKKNTVIFLSIETSITGSPVDESTGNEYKCRQSKILLLAFLSNTNAMHLGLLDKWCL